MKIFFNKTGIMASSHWKHGEMSYPSSSRVRQMSVSSSSRTFGMGVLVALNERDEHRFYKSEK